MGSEMCIRDRDYGWFFLLMFAPYLLPYAPPLQFQVSLVGESDETLKTRANEFLPSHPAIGLIGRKIAGKATGKVAETTGKVTSTATPHDDGVELS